MYAFCLIPSHVLEYICESAIKKALLTSNLCLFSRPIDGVTVKCNQIVLETATKHCRPTVQILHKDDFDLKLPMILPLSGF